MVFQKIGGKCHRGHRLCNWSVLYCRRQHSARQRPFQSSRPKGPDEMGVGPVEATTSGIIMRTTARPRGVTGTHVFKVGVLLFLLFGTYFLRSEEHTSELQS